MRLFTMILATLITLGFLTGPSDGFKFGKLFKRFRSTPSNLASPSIESMRPISRNTQISSPSYPAGSRANVPPRTPWARAAFLGALGLTGMGAAGSGVELIGQNWSVQQQANAVQQRIDAEKARNDNLIAQQKWKLEQNLAAQKAQNDRLFEYQKKQDEEARKLKQKYRDEDRANLKKNEHITQLKAKLLAQQEEINQLLEFINQPTE